MRYQSFKIGGGFSADTDLLVFLNTLPATHRIISIKPGRYGKYNGLDEEYEHGHLVVVDTAPETVR